MGITAKPAKGLRTTTRLKVAIAGRPGAISKQKTGIATLFLIPTLPPLPKGLPLPAAPQPLPVLAFFASKAWRAIEGMINDPQQRLIIEGIGIPEPDLSGLIVLATHATARTISS